MRQHLRSVPPRAVDAVVDQLAQVLELVSAADAAGADEFAVQLGRINVNDQLYTPTGIETISLAGLGGDDTFSVFDSDASTILGKSARLVPTISTI